MIYWIFLFMWIITIISLIIFLKQENKGKYILIFSQLYNFITGFLSFAIFFISTILGIKYLGNIFDDLYLIYIISGLVLVILLMPLNIKCKKKINISKISYFVLSIISIILGIGLFILINVIK